MQNQNIFKIGINKGSFKFSNGQKQSNSKCKQSSERNQTSILENFLISQNEINSKIISPAILGQTQRNSYSSSQKQIKKKLYLNEDNLLTHEEKESQQVVEDDQTKVNLKQCHDQKQFNQKFELWSYMKNINQIQEFNKQVKRYYTFPYIHSLILVLLKCRSILILNKSQNRKSKTKLVNNYLKKFLQKFQGKNNYQKVKELIQGSTSLKKIFNYSFQNDENEDSIKILKKEITFSICRLVRKYLVNINNFKFVFNLQYQSHEKSIQNYKEKKVQLTKKLLKFIAFAFTITVLTVKMIAVQFNRKQFLEYVQKIEGVFQYSKIYQADIVQILRILTQFLIISTQIQKDEKSFNKINEQLQNYINNEKQINQDKVTHILGLQFSQNLTSILQSMKKDKFLKIPQVQIEKIQRFFDVNLDSSQLMLISIKENEKIYMKQERCRYLKEMLLWFHSLNNFSSQSIYKPIKDAESALQIYSLLFCIQSNSYSQNFYNFEIKNKLDLKQIQTWLKIIIILKQKTILFEDYSKLTQKLNQISEETNLNILKLYYSVFVLISLFMKNFVNLTQNFQAIKQFQTTKIFKRKELNVQELNHKTKKQILIELRALIQVQGSLIQQLKTGWHNLKELFLDIQKYFKYFLNNNQKTQEQIKNIVCFAIQAQRKAIKAFLSNFMKSQKVQRENIQEFFFNLQTYLIDYQFNKTDLIHFNADIND